MNTPGPLPICFRCAYDLTGLELPRACPECGALNDPQADAAAARAWFADIRRVLKGIVRPSTIPPGVAYVLYDPASVRIARRRRFLWLWLPAILTTVLVAVGMNVSVTYNAKVWWYEKSDPTRKPLWVTNEPPQEDRVFGLNLHFFRGGIFVRPWPTWVEVVEPHNRRFKLSVPTEIEPLAFYWGCGPLFAILLGYLPVQALLIWFARRSGGWHTVSPQLTSLRTSLTVVTLPLGAVLWAWLAMVVLIAATQCFATGAIGGVGVVLFWLPVVAWPVAAGVGYFEVVSQDRGQTVLPWGRWTAVAVAVLILGGHVAFVVVFRLLYM